LDGIGSNFDLIEEGLWHIGFLFESIPREKATTDERG
jgi:hypothetical protein